MEEKVAAKEGKARGARGDKDRNKDVGDLREFAYSEYVPGLQCFKMQEPLAEPSSGAPMYPPQRQLGIEYALKAHEDFMTKHYDEELTVKRFVVFLLSDFGCRECSCKDREVCDHPKIVKEISVPKSSHADWVSGWKGLELEKRRGWMLLDLAMLGHNILLKEGKPSLDAIYVKHKMGENLMKGVATKQCNFWTARVPKKAAAPPPGNSSEGSTSAHHAAASLVPPRDAVGEFLPTSPLYEFSPSDHEEGEESEGESDDVFTMLMQAAADGDLNKVKELLAQGAEFNSVDNNGDTALSHGAMHGHEAVVQQLLDEGAGVNSANNDGDTALSLGAMHGHEYVVHQLLIKGVEFDRADNNGDTALSLGAMRGHEAVVQQLLDKGAGVHCVDINGDTPLSQAAMKGHKAVVQQLLDNSADVNHANIKGNTALSQAAKNGKTRVVKQLLANGANPEHANAHGNTALYWAHKKGWDRIVVMLTSKM